MNTASFAVRKYSERDQFREGVRIEATKNQEDASKMFIGGLSRELNKQALLEYLSQFGEIIDFIIKVDPNTGLSRGFGFVLFKDSSTVEKVLRVKDHKVNGKKIEFKRAKAIESQFPVKKVFVGGLNPQMSEEKIRAYFGTFGQIEALELPICSDTHERRAFGFVKYVEEKPARKVLETRYHFIGSSRCEVKIALPKENQGKQQNKSKAKAKNKAKKTVPSDGLESHWGGVGSQSVHLMANSDAQEANQDAHRAGPCTSRANSDVTVATASGFRAIPSTFQANSNDVATNPSAITASQNALGSNSNTAGVSHNTLETNSNAFWTSQYTLATGPNAFRTSQYTLGPYPNACGVSQYTFSAYPNAFGVSQCAVGSTPNAFWTNQYPLRTYPNAFGVNQYASGTNSNTYGACQYTVSANSDAFRPNYYAYMANPYDCRTSHCVLAPNPSVYRTSQFGLGANPNAFGASQYAVGATSNSFGAYQNAYGANGNFWRASGSGGSTERFNFSQVYGNFLNVYNTLPAFQGSNGDYFFLYSYGSYDLGSALNYNVQINQSTVLGNGYQGIYSAF